MHSLHSGLTFGPLGIAVTVLSGFCLVALSLLGLARWWQRWAVTLLASVRKAPLRTAEQNKKSRIGQPHL